MLSSLIAHFFDSVGDLLFLTRNANFRQRLLPLKTEIG
jgi:hypothetical protein